MALSKIDTGGLAADAVDNTILDLAGDYAGMHFGGTGSANQLDDYEEGTWVPTDASGAGISFAVAAGMYTKVGRLVVATFRVQYPSTSNGANALIGGLPFTAISAPNQQHQGSAIRFSNVGSAFALANNTLSTTFQPLNFSGSTFTNANFSGKTIDAAIIYQTS
jgi:hypothetical protein